MVPARDALQSRYRRRLLETAAGMASLCAAPTWAFSAGSAGPLQAWGNRPTPELTASDLEGHAKTLAEFSGRVVLLNFWATYCAPCRAEMPSLVRLAQRYRDQGLVLVGLNHGEMPARVRIYLKQVAFDGTPLLDRNMTQLARWGSDALPSSVMIDRQGQACLMHVGELDWDRPDVARQVASLL